ncbi:MAG: hypothetical protein HY782_22920 [Chloroflexi bacterium]|nr:hypothetical protein [Chloroflexota bacterium]
MADQPTKPRRRPIDALFGDDQAPPLPTYSVEPPQPVTTITPPPPAPLPELIPTPVSQSETAAKQPSPSAPATVTVPATQPPNHPTTQLPNYLTTEQPTLAPEPMPAPTVLQPQPVEIQPPEAAPVEVAQPDPYFANLSETIRRLYEQVNTQLSDSSTAGDYCMRMLLEARESYLQQDYARAEYYVESVEAKLKRTARSVQVSRSPQIWLLWIWELGTLGASALLIAITFIPGLTLFGLPVAPELLTLMRAAGWGAIGGVIGALYNLPWFFQYREYDPAYTANYFARPLLGLALGAILFLISQAGLIAGNAFVPALPGTSGPTEIPVGPIFLAVFAVLAGFKQEYVFQFFDDVLRSIFRIPRLPNGLEMPKPPKR